MRLHEVLKGHPCAFLGGSRHVSVNKLYRLKQKKCGFIWFNNLEIGCILIVVVNAHHYWSRKVEDTILNEGEFV